MNPFLEWDLPARVAWYTHDYSAERQQRQQDRDRLLASAREADALAAVLSSLADDLRRLAA